MLFLLSRFQYWLGESSWFVENTVKINKIPSEIHLEVDRGILTTTPIGVAESLFAISLTLKIQYSGI